MSRLVRPATAGATLGTRDGPGSRSASDGDNYRERLIKYIPAETIAVYTFVDKAILSGAGSNGGSDGGGNAISTGEVAETLDRVANAPTQVQEVLSVVIFLVALVGTVAYLYRQRVGNEPWKLHAGLAVAAFIAWSYTLGGSIWVYNGLYNTLVAAVAAPIFTYVAPLFQPKAATTP